MTQTGQELSEWLSAFGFEFREIRPLAGDVSRRLYSRVTGKSGSTFIAVSYPSDMQEACVRFRATSKLLASAGVRVPQILESSCREGIMLLEDAGDISLYDLARSSWETLRPLYAQALAELRRIQAVRLPTVETINPALDGAALRNEVDYCWEELLDRPEVCGPPKLRRLLRRVLDDLCSALYLAPAVTCHRDFMPRNLLVAGEPRQIVVIDHQDLRPGPRHYDLASLLNDSVFPPPGIERELRAEAIEGEEDLLLYRRCVVQRALKASHTFVRFARLGDPRHLRLVRPTLGRAARQLTRLPEGVELGAELASRWEAMDPAGLVENQPR